MPTLDFESILNTIKTGIINIGKTSLANYLPQVTADAGSITNAIKADVQNWTSQLANNEITSANLKFLIAADEEYLKVAALTEVGLAQIQLDQFKQDVCNLIVGTLTAAIKV